jgi:hypothetical protein
MTDRIVVDRYNFESTATDQLTVDGNKVQKFVNWLLNNNGWLDAPDLLVERAMKLRRELKEDMRIPEPFLVKANVKRDPEKGKFVSKAPR